jgi:hypothetical protein
MDRHAREHSLPSSTNPLQFEEYLAWNPGTVCDSFFVHKQENNSSSTLQHSIFFFLFAAHYQSFP